MQQSNFDLLNNPFAILRIGVRSTRAEAAAARDEVVWEHDIDEDNARQAYAVIASPKGRLASEIGFLLGMNPATARKAIDAVRQGNLSLPAGETPVVAAVNLLAHGLSLGGDPAEWGSGLVDAYDALEVDAVTEEIVANCQISGERAPSAKEVDAALSKLAERHGEVLAQALATADTASLAENIVEYWPDGEMASRLGDAFIAAYRRQIAQPLLAHEERIGSLEKALLANPSIGDAQSLANALVDWDRLRQPVQIWDASHGLDEPDSERLGERLRDLTVRLVNKKKAFAEARVVLDALLAAFPELPTLSRKLERASEELDEAAADAAAEKAMGPLLIAVESIVTDQAAADNHLGASVATSTWPKAEVLRAAFAEAIKHDPTIAVRIVRNLAIKLHNEHSQSAAALRLTEWLQQTAPNDTDPETIRQLAVDEKTLSETHDVNRLNSAIERADNSFVAEIAIRLASRTKDTEERKKWLSIAAEAGERKRKKTTKAWFYATALALGFLFLFFSGDEKQSYEEAPAAEAPAAEYYDPAAEESPPAADAMAPAADAMAPAADAMEPPAYLPDAGASRDNYRGQKDSVQYSLCQYLESEIKSDENSVDTSNEDSVNSFNSKVERYNSECTGRWR